MEPLINDFHAELWALQQALRERMRTQHDRSLPSGELLGDRWERAEFLGFGKGTSVHDDCIVFGQPTVGADSWIGPNTILDGSGGLSIGRFCAISAGVQIYTHDTVFRNLSGGTMPLERRPVSIGDCCYIGPYAVITKGVTIGNHCLVGAHSMVNRDMPDYTIAVGVPAKNRGKVLVDAEGQVTLRWDPV